MLVENLAATVAGALILMLLPTRTDTLFFWPIKPPINAGLFGALYLGGATAVSLATWHNRWEPARYLIPILVTAGILISWVTLLHRDAFAPGIPLGSCCCTGHNPGPFLSEWRKRGRRSCRK